MSMPVQTTTNDDNNFNMPQSSGSTEDFFTTDPGIPFHLLKRKKAAQTPDPFGSSQLHGLQDMFHTFSERSIKNGLSNFLPHLTGFIDAPSTNDDSLQSLIDKPPVGGRELTHLSDASLQGFRLMPGSVPQQFKFMNKPPDKKRKKKHKHHEESKPGTSLTGDTTQERKHKKRKKEEGDKKKKEKKKKKKKDKKGDQEDPTAS